MHKQHKLITELLHVAEVQGTSPAQLALASGYSKRAMNTWIKGSREPNIEALESMALTLGLELALLPVARHSHTKAPRIYADPERQAKAYGLLIRALATTFDQCLAAQIKQLLLEMETPFNDYHERLSSGSSDRDLGGPQ